jgi:type IV pilus assembly protein PilM
MLDLFNLKQETFGLNISNLSLKFLKLKKKGTNLSLSSFGQKEIEPGIVEQGEIKNEDSLAKIIKTALREAKGKKIKTKQVIAALPEEKGFLQIIQMPKMTKQDLESAVIYEAENYIPLPIEQVYLDFQIIQPLNNNQKYFDILIVALPKKVVDPYVFCLKKAGLKPIALEIESLSISRALIKEKHNNQSIVLINLGRNRTSFILFSNNSVLFTASIPVFSQHFTDIISKALKIDATKAEELKIRQGLKEGGEIFKILIPSLIDLTEQIKKYLTYCQTHILSKQSSVNYQKITKILLCGGGANLQGLSYFLSLELKLPVIIGNPWINILTNSLENKESLNFTIALGLALRGIKND